MSGPTANLAELLDAALPVALRHIPHRIRDVAEQLGVRTALVGGVPRDLLRIRFGQLDREAYRSAVRDFDVVVQGDAVAFAYELVRRLPGKLTVNADFSTATIVTDDPAEIDVASARTEHYPTAGLLPQVELGATLEDDLVRRDFTVNCLALSLSEPYGALLDVVGGAADIGAKLIRSLHAGSFYEDPTRLFRALRYVFRLGYDFEPVTQQQLSCSIEDGNLDLLSPERVRYELELIAREERWADVWQAMHFSGLLLSLHEGLSEVYTGWLPSDARALDIALRARGDLLEAEGLQSWLVRTAWALGGVETLRLEQVCRRIGLFDRHIRWITQARAVLREAFTRTLQQLPSSLACALLEQYARQSVVIAAFTFQPRSDEEVTLRKALLRYLEEYSHVRSELDSDELLALGLPPGPRFGELRSRLRYLRIDGIISTVDEEREYARQFIAGPDDAPESDS